MAAKNSDAFARINFLMQASALALSKFPQSKELSRFYTTHATQIAQKKVLRLHKSMKRSICKKCSTLLRPGVTARVRTAPRREKHVIVTCLYCGNMKRFHCSTVNKWNNTDTFVSS
ncbi:hypothetical protein PTSG_06736 [Salpingoeca rosetta]|uniref:Uncharacterized protein n=1 Tax=Salpingoeca rosetta (strain ATCC 50818 / BSB-021) TaxID=946362 RepID=F2UEN0_SALR5|nr:uncharacterized protein PTSG_06736 [Salpingoeca rosetta]EGD75080.1 hypothetical protein PTSG_06736 [Salpingoeca rosetta]|eukprot:XP_004992133.1 hypothetical protein PTSG_06736 [Salpingoeca rosetta]